VAKRTTDHGADLARHGQSRLEPAHV